MPTSPEHADATSAETAITSDGATPADELPAEEAADGENPDPGTSGIAHTPGTGRAEDKPE